MEIDERKLLRAAKDGDKEAFQQLILAYYPYVTKFLLKLCGNEQDAEDLTQETFLKLIRGIRKYEARTISSRAPSQSRTWAPSIAEATRRRRCWRSSRRKSA